MSDNQRVKVLVVSGGGVRGMLPCRFLREVKKEDLDKIDVFSGTSIGGILALYLISHDCPDSLFYEFKAAVPRIFHSPWYRKWNPFNSKYSAKGIESVLKEMLPKKVSDISRKFVIPTFGFKRERPIVFHNFDESFYHYDLWKIARATSATPLFFPPYSENIFLDGGILENMPIITSASMINKHLGIKAYDMDVFVIGTGVCDVDADKSLKEVNCYGAFTWAKKLLPFLTTGGNEMMSILWGENIGFNSFTMFNPVCAGKTMDDVELVRSGELEEKCELYIGDFKKKWKEFIDR